MQALNGFDTSFGTLPVSTPGIGPIRDLPQQLKQIIDQNNLKVAEILTDSAYNTNMTIAKNLAPDEKEIKLREERAKDVRKKRAERKQRVEDRIEKEIKAERLDDELVAKRENLV